MIATETLLKYRQLFAEDGVDEAALVALLSSSCKACGNPGALNVTCQANSKAGDHKRLSAGLALCLDCIHKFSQRAATWHERGPWRAPASRTGGTGHNVQVQVTGRR